MTKTEIQQVKQRFGIIGNTEALLRAIDVAIQVAPTDLSVLITGESGVGKESFPQIIHQFSRRKHGPYIAVNCGAIPEGTIDSELFGHEKGAFTGAISDRNGYFAEANGGTIFLDEVGELPLSTQARLLRVLESGEYIKVGSSKVQKTDVRIVAATNVNFADAIAEGRFREDLYYRLIKPIDFDPNKKYPVIEYIYQGPGDQYVPKTFRPYDWNMTSLAELGFIVVMVDGMGTSFRSRAFENVCYKNLKDAGLPDHIAWIKAAARKYPYMDVDRVGIYGCSAGGQESTNAVLLYPDFYKAAYSACGCHDNRMDKIWWNELWLGYPVGDQYKEGSNVENAHLLSRPLMLVVGELDDNVDPASTMQVVNALIKANKDFELVVIPGAHHTMGEDFGEHKRYDFFVRHLMQVNPPKWDEIK